MAKYDDASWHYGGDYPADLPPENGATHIGIFMKASNLFLIKDSGNGKPIRDKVKLYKEQFTTMQAGTTENTRTAVNPNVRCNQKHLSSMAKIFITLLLTLIAKFSGAQTTINLALKNELDSIFQLDQKYRLLLTSEELQSRPESVARSYGVETSQLQNFLITKLVSIDSSNIKRIDEIIHTYGYPGKSLVGEPANEAAFFVIQHSQSIDKFLPLVKEAARKKELPFGLYAMMLDRSLMYSGKEQVYGTQGKGIQVLNTATGQKEFKMIIWPIKKPKKVNKLRKKAGFTDTVEENAKRMGINYVPYTVAEINKMKAD